MKQIIRTAGVLLLLTGCVSQGQQNLASANNVAASTQSGTGAAAAGSDQDLAQAENDDKDRLICKRTTVTGSRFAKRVCMTWQEWQAISDQASKATDDLQRPGIQSSSPVR